MPALSRGIPLYLGVLLLAQLVLQAAPLHRALGELPALVPVVGAAWALLVSYLRGPLFGAPQTDYLRSLPVSNAVVSGTIVLALVCIDWPWVIVCIASRSPAVMLTGPLLTAAVHAAIGSRRWFFVLGAAGLLGLGTVVPLWLLAPPALVLAWVSAPVAWNVTRPGRVTRHRWLHLPVPWWGITRSLWTAATGTALRLARRVLTIHALTIGAAVLAVRNNAFTSLASILTASLIFLGIGLPFVLSRPTAAVIETGWQLTWLFDATGTTRRARSLAGASVAVFMGSILGGTHGIAVSWASAPHVRWQMAAIEAVAGALLALVILGLAALAATPAGLDPGRQMNAVLAAPILVPLAVGISLTGALLLGIGAAAAGAVIYHARVARRDEARTGAVT